MNYLLITLHHVSFQESVGSAPDIFRGLANILAGLPGVRAYIVDKKEEHERRLEAVLARLTAANMKLNWAKCLLRHSSVKYLDRVIGSHGVSPDPEKIQATANLAKPKQLSAVCRFLGMVTS